MTIRRTGMARVGVVFAATLAALTMTTASVARDSKAAWTDDVVAAIDTLSGTITVGDQVLSVASTAELKDADGRPIRIGELRIGQMVSYVASESRSGVPGQLSKLQIVEGDFE